MKKLSAVLAFAVLSLSLCRAGAVPFDVPAANPIILMTVPTGSPTRAEVTDLLCRYNEVGIKQAMIYPRSGVEIEYMSPRWIRLCRDFVEVADSLGMKIWLYDEFNWPSGNCRGEVTADGHDNLYPKTLLFSKSPDGTYTTVVVPNRTGADILDPEAVARFVALTHERYYSELGRYFGDVIPAIFTDEPSFSYSLTSAKGIQMSNFSSFDSSNFGLAWYEGLESDYENRYGRDLHADVVAFLQGGDGSALWSGYYTLVGERMREVYIRTISDWCEAHGVHLTGHLMYEKLYKSVRCNGNILRALSLFGLPGFDEANSDIDIDAREMEVSGLALVQYASRGREGALCELYSVGPADLSLSIQRQLMWMCSCFGVNNYLMAVAAMDARGNREKGDWYYSSGPTQPWFDYYRELGAEAVKAAEFARKPYEPEVLVRVPSIWFASLDKTPAFEKRGLVYLRFLEDLLKYQLQFALLDEDEDPQGIPVMGYGPEGLYLEGEDGRFDDPDAFVRHVTEVVQRRAVACNEDGSEARNVLLRRYADGSLVIVDLTDNDAADRILTVRTPEGAGSVRLLGHDAWAGRLEDMDAPAPMALIPFDFSSCRVSTGSAPALRCIFTQKDRRFSFVLPRKEKGVRLLLRDVPEPVSAYLDGKPVEAAESTDALPYGFAKLYRSTAPMKLKAGEHTVSFGDGETDWRYLPAAFLSGVKDRSNYAGTYDVSVKVDIPAAAVALRLDTNLACTEVLLDGVSIGRRAWGPFEWDIPGHFAGSRHTLTVRISTSIMPLFGNISLLDDDQPYASWLRIRPGQHGDKSYAGPLGAWWVTGQ